MPAGLTSTLSPSQPVKTARKEARLLLISRRPPAAVGELGQDAGTSGPQGSFCEVVGRVLDLETLANEGYRLPSNEEPSLAECNVGEGSPAQL